MRRLILIGLFAGLLAPAGLHAQKVYKKDNKVILDMSVKAGMPAGAVTATRKYTSFTPQADVLGADNDHNGSINATVFHKLEIAPKDMNKNGGMNGTGTLTMDWVTAFNGCKNSTYDNGRWRLPTQRELHMMWIFRPALNNLCEAPLLDETFWSATEGSVTNSWFMIFITGAAASNKKSFNRNVRCVREIVD